MNDKPNPPSEIGSENTHVADGSGSQQSAGAEVIDLEVSAPGPPTADEPGPLAEVIDLAASDSPASDPQTPDGDSAPVSLRDIGSAESADVVADLLSLGTLETDLEHIERAMALVDGGEFEQAEAELAKCSPRVADADVTAEVIDLVAEEQQSPDPVT